MALTEKSTIWTGKSTGITLEEHEGKYAIKAVRKYQKDGKDTLTFDWVYREEWNKDTRAKEMQAKPRPCSVFLGDKDQAIDALKSMLASLGVADDNEPPF